ncbi:hypothetical protein EJ05DRAFT_16642 [Pseudovirgaria hyperparasitica]|uniref:Exosome complex component CSL4 C-terminal domain-containing protein n=1 Tax=Pseudovirgaria hyperparasitica TaxID=470096 RepID=A0A6A6WKX9_9PEZI|nr:uncharacterized protein EJ05DRAFT_16642 [Pseudovirgaria hyperparasitica]KAF2762823.1 hypothetical protein EJ05DRAFT_16642 [Pseudovirgaria hyperparasitica]
MSAPLVLPGQPLKAVASSSPGSGTHSFSGALISSVAGTLKSAPAKSQTRATVSVARAPPAPGQGSAILPEVESIVLARVTRLSTRQAQVEILVIGDKVCREAFQGIVRREDVRATEKDRVVIADSFRVGDVVKGIVISLGDQSSYYISTASNELGVIMATSEAGHQMYPISWREFKDPTTGAVETRKVAKPF